MRLRSSIVWIVGILLCISVVTLAGQGRGGGGRGGNNRGGNPRGGGNPQPNNNEGNNPRGRNQPAEGGPREDVLRVQNKARIMLEMVEMLQRRTGRPISYEDPLWAYESAMVKGADGKVTERPGDIKRTEGFRDPSKPNVPVKPMLNLATGSFEFRLLVDGRSHLLPEPIDGSIGAVLTAVLADYKNKQLPGSFIYSYLGKVEEGGFGWIVLPDRFRDAAGNWVEPRRVLDYPVSFPVEERTTAATFQLITQLVSKASGQQVQFKKLASEANWTGGTTNLKPVDLPAKQFVRLGATNETARSVIAKALRNIERGDPRTAAPIPQRAWRLLYSIDARGYFLDVVEVRKESYRPDGNASGSRVVNWPAAAAQAASAEPGSATNN